MKPVDKKELKNAYKQMKPQMGVFTVRNINNQKCFIEASNDIQSMFNRIRFQLGMGMHPCKPLQEDWNKNKEQSFSFEVLDTLSYSKDESKTDYKEELKLLKTLWIEKLTKEDSENLY
ncbi:MAG: GIY-YIG nuclease family protein [Deltaproteobacteria bacterium]|nr:GIY-YIG nuclease family protein [Deltaproteobacteria bacterium]